MHDELAARHRAITLRLAGRPVKSICAAVGRSECWFHKWWRRYRQSGAEGLFDLTRANHHAQRIPPELERTIPSIRRRLQAHASPTTRYSLIGAHAILVELKTLNVHPLPAARTIERVMERNGLTLPRVRLAPLLPRQEYPGPQARASNQLHEVDLVGPIYLKGRGHRYYILRTDNASRSFFRQRIAELFAFPTDNASRRSVAGLTHWVVAMLLTRLSAEFKMSPAGDRQRPQHA